MRIPVCAAVIIVTLCVSCINNEKNPNADESNSSVNTDDAQRSRAPVAHTVEIIQMKFVPEVLNIYEGDTVIWINRDMVQHDVTETSKNLWRSSRIGMGASWKNVFNRSQGYHCSLHVVMTGKILVDGEDVAHINTPADVTTCSGITGNQLVKR